MSERSVRGYMFFGTGKYLETAYDDATRAVILDAMSPRVRGLMAKVDNVTWYPREDISEVLGTIAAYHHQKDGKEREALEGIGSCICETATNTFLKLIMRILTPSLFQSKLPDFWRRDHKFGALTPSLFDTNQRRMLVSLTDVEGYDYIGPVAQGFMRFALNGVFNYANVRCKYDWDIKNPGPASIDYEFTWG